MADPFHHDDLTHLTVRRDATHLYAAFKHIIEDAPARIPEAVVIAACVLFTNCCATAEVDPSAALDQILELLERGELGLRDDPARGRYIHPPGRA